MGTLIKNKSLDINFEVGEINQADLEKYEHEFSRYVIEANSTSEAVLLSAIVRGAIDSEWIPENVLKASDVSNSSPGKIAFLAARISEIVNDSKEKDGFELDFEMPEITQGALENYEKQRDKIVKDVNLLTFEVALANSLMVQIGIALEWIPENIMTLDNIPTSRPYEIKYLANMITSNIALSKTVSSE